MADSKQDRNQKIKSRQLTPREESPDREKQTRQAGSKTARNKNINRKKSRKKKKIYSGKSDDQRQPGPKQSGSKQTGKQRVTGKESPKQTNVRDQRASKSTKKQQQNQKPGGGQQIADQKKTPVVKAQTPQKATAKREKTDYHQTLSRKRHFDHIDEKRIRAVETTEDIVRDIEQIERDIRLDIDGIQTINLDL